MKCSNCRQDLTSVPTKDNAGQVFEFQKCGHCGSFFFEGTDLFRLDPAEAAKIDTNRPGEIKKDLICDKCQKNLNKIVDPYIPSSIDLFRCKGCNGYFIPAGHLVLYKKYQEKRFKPKINKKESVVLSTIAWLIFLSSWVYLYFLEKGDLALYAEEFGEKTSPQVSFLSQNYLFLVSSFVAVLGLSFYLFSRRFKNIILITVLLLSLVVFGLGAVYH